MNIAKSINTFLVLLLLATAGVAHAEWSDSAEIALYEDGTRVYVDPAGALEAADADTAELMHLVRWGESQQDEGLPAYRSTVVRSAYHCGQKLERYLSSKSYGGSMGDGPRVQIDDHAAESWTTISPGSMEEKLWAVACHRP